MTAAEISLLELLRERCYKEGDFILSSGKKSRYYFDAKTLFMSSVGASLIGQILYERTKDLGVQAIGGLEVGAIPIATAAIYVYGQHGREMEGFFVRNEAKTHGTKKIVEGNLKPGCKVVIVDDVATSGNSIMKAVEAVRKAECQPVMVTVLMDRLEGARELFAAEGIPFEPLFTLDDFKKQAGK